MTSNVELKPFGAVSDSMGMSSSQAHAPAAHNAQTSWREHLRNRLNRWMVSPALYQWSVSNVLTRWFTQKRTREVFDLMAGFVHFQVLLNCLRLGVLARVQQSPCTLNDLALYTGLPEDRLDRLVWSAVSLKLMDQRSAGRYGIGPLGVLVVSYPGIEAMVEHNALLYADMGDTPKMLRSQAGVDHALMHQYWPYTVGEDSEDAALEGKTTMEHRTDASNETHQTERYS